MKADPLLPRAAAALAALLVLAAAAPASRAQNDGKSDLPATRYIVLNHTGNTLACRYRIGTGSWRSHRAIAASGNFNVQAGSTSETLTLDCSPQTARHYALRPGLRYRAVRENGRVVLKQVVA